MPNKFNVITSVDLVTCVEPFLKTKFKDWEYEKEVRIFLLERWMKSPCVSYPCETLESVTIGLKSELREIKKIYRAVVKSGCNIRWFRTSMHERNYELIIEEIPDIESFISSFKKANI
ncbi:hypothetical protein LEP1GSC036_0941 [Leptospira weilii str. 2006001853]|uniref:Uncharacterized protein n=3 Tax=Leptospira weilii TaxID=28184 RepID=A0A828YY20_9LEPT|nr:hypothetical protein LEP1GSC036_0941 [Leptospira weilii str. 2006001853]EMM70789.1 hypothetical protein LEP1GSC038_2114 [Leptospira weilii str. 2006001855]QDK24696.1 hypothetical protein FHG67_05175 [Leptospira weilii]QDK28647.1 hypothetical protein FHG68_05090 [Leptospira weilii]